MLAILTVRIRDFYPVTGILQLDFPVLTILDTPVTRYLRLIPLYLIRPDIIRHRTHYRVLTETVFLLHLLLHIKTSAQTGNRRCIVIQRLLLHPLPVPHSPVLRTGIKRLSFLPQRLLQGYHGLPSLQRQ
ncbi:TPA: hypothetical protein ACH7ER_004953, partial [Escherichia coli]